jgi:hypothetical protein
MAEDASPPLSIGSIVGGESTATEPWQLAIRDLSRRIIAASAGVSSIVGLNVVYMVPGHLIQPDFEGVFLARFSRKRSCLLVNVAVPRTPQADASAFLRESLLRAVDEAEVWAAKRHRTGDVENLRTIARRATTDA